MEDIVYVGAKQLTELNRILLDKITKTYYKKIKRALNNITSIKVVIKEYKKEGTKRRQKFSVHVQAIAPTKKFVSTHAHDWDFARALHKAFRDVEIEIKHEFHVDDTTLHVHHKKFFVMKKEWEKYKQKERKRN